MKKISKKFLQILMLISMIFSSLQTPIAVFAAEVGSDTGNDSGTAEAYQAGDIKLGVNGTVDADGSVSTTDSSDDGKVQVTKTVTADPDVLGKYKVELEVEGTVSEEEVPTYIVVVFDTSGSMCNSYFVCTNWTKYYNAVSAAKSFAETIIDTLPKSKIALVTFSDDAIQQRGFEHAYLDDGDFESPGGATNLHDGLVKAKDYLDNGIAEEDKDTANKYVVVMSDGEPTYYNGGGNGQTTEKDVLDYTLSAAADIKNSGAEIFSIGYALPTGIVYPGDYEYDEVTYTDLTARKILELVASPDVSGSDISHYSSANSEDDITGVFEDLAKNLIIPGTKATLIDNIGSNFKVVQDNSGSTPGGSYTANSNGFGGSYTSNVIEEITSDSIKFSFDIEINPDASTGWHQTNAGFTLSYTDVNGEEQTLGDGALDPYVYWVQKTYKYVANYYTDSISDDNIIASDEREAVVGTKINESNVDKNKYLETAGEGYEFNKVDPSEIVITNDGTVSEINVLYTLKEYAYKVNYYYDNKLDNTIEENEIVHGTVVDTEKYYLADEDIREGYKLDTNNSAKDSVTINKDGIEINIYYVKDSFEYSVNYYFNNTINEDLSLDKQLGLYGEEIKAEDKYLDSSLLEDNGYGDYFLDPEASSNKDKITIGIDPSKNILDIYYINSVASGEVITKESNKDVISASSELVDYTVKYSANISNVRVEDKIVVTLVDTLPGGVAIDVDKSNLNKGIYNSTDNTITWTFNFSVEEYTKNYKVDVSVEYTLLYLDFADMSSSTENTLINSVHGSVSINTKTTVGVKASEEIPVLIDGTITVKHVDQNGVDLVVQEVKSGKVGENYTESKKDIYGYSYASDSGNTAGKYIEGNIEVVFKYTKNEGKVTENEIVKEGPTSSSDINGVFKYTLTYAGKIEEYVGDVTLKVVDNLPYKIDTDKSSYDDRCVYSEENMTITCIETYEIDKDNQNISDSFELSLVYIGIDENTVSNSVDVTLTYGEKESTTDDDEVTEIYSGSVIATYKDTLGNVLATEEKSSGLAGSEYKTSAKDIYGYTLNNDPENKIGTYKANETIYVEYEYVKNAGTVTENVTTKTQINKELGANSKFEYVLEYNGKIDNYKGTVMVTLVDKLSYSVSSIEYDKELCSFSDGTLICSKEVTIDENNQLIDVEFKIVVTYNNLTSEVDLSIKNEVKTTLVYGDKNIESSDDVVDTIKASKVTAVYEDIDGNTLAESETTKGLVGSEYKTSAKDIYGYTLSNNPENKTGIYTESEIVVKYIYTKNEGKVTENEIVKEGPTSSSDINGVFKYTLTYTGKIEEYVGDVTLKVVDNLPYKIDTDKSSYDDRCVYSEENMTITCIETYEIDKDNQNISDSFELSLVYIGIDENTVSNSVDVTLTYGEKESTTDDDEVTEIYSGSVIATYKDTLGNVLATEEKSSGLAGSKYVTSEKNILGYTLSNNPENKTGTYQANQTIYVEYVYTKNIGSSEEQLKKIGSAEVVGINEKFEYTITYNTIIEDYVGDIKIQIIDELPYELDIEKSDIGDICKYTNGLLVCEYNKTIKNELDSNISITENLVLYYKNVTDGLVTNTVKSILTYGDVTKINEDSTVSEVLSGKVIVNYVTEDGKVLTDSILMEGLVGSKYATNKKVFDNYYLKEVIGEENGTYSEEDTEVTYVYSLVPLPPQTGFESNIINYNYLSLVLGVLVLLLVKRRM